MERAILKVAAYCRVSTDKTDQINSLSAQIKYFTHYIGKHENWIMRQIYADEGRSGTSMKKRDGFNQMMQDALNGKIDLILTKEVSRFARNTVDTLSCTRKLKDAGVGVLFVTDNIDTRESDGELRLSIMASIAQEESRKTSERVKWGQHRRMEEGVVFGRDLLGYFVRDGKLSVNIEESKIVKLIFYKFLLEGKGSHIIARELHEAGIEPKRGKVWSNTTILRILRNEKYVGDLCQKKTVTPNYLDHIKRYNQGQEEMIYLKDHHEPIISRSVWEKTQKELERRSPSASQRSKYSNRYWCSGKIECGECGQRFVSRTKQQVSGGYQGWRCYAAARNGRMKKTFDGNVIGCDNASINERVLIHCISYALNNIITVKKQMAQDILRMIEREQKNRELSHTAHIQTEIARLQMKKHKAIDFALEGSITKAEMLEQKRQYSERIERLTHKLNVNAKNNLLLKQQAGQLEQLKRAIDDALKIDKNGTHICGEIIEKIVVYMQNRLTLYLKNLPYAFKFRYAVSGKLDQYIVKVEEFAVTKNTQTKSEPAKAVKAFNAQII